MIPFKHLKDVDQTYFEHLCDALGIAKTLMCCIPKIIIHAFYPDFFSQDVSRELKKIVTNVQNKKDENQRKRDIELDNFIKDV